MTELIIASVMTMMTAATPLIFAATGELVCEKSGVLNLGVEGMMLIGAVFGFAAVSITGQPLIGVGAGITAVAVASFCSFWS